MEQKNKPQAPKAKPVQEKVDADEAKEAFAKTQQQFAPPPGMVKSKAAVKTGDIKPAAEVKTNPAKDALAGATKPAPAAEAPPAPPPPAPEAAPAADSPYLAQHTVVAGDSLVMISQKYYGTQNHFMKIYQANKDIIGNDPSRIRPGQQLNIPKI